MTKQAQQQGGWIKLHRKILNNWVWEDPEKLRAWLDILLMVNHEDKQIQIDGHIVTIKAGQRHTSVYKLAERWKWSRKRVISFLGLLKEAEMVTTVATTKGTTITVVNWALYQFEGTTEGTTNGTAVDTTVDTTVVATVGTTVDTKTRKNKNDKNEKEKAQSAERRERAETKKGTQRKTDLDAWLRNQMQERLSESEDDDIED